jgi:hypothetical protein
MSGGPEPHRIFKNFLRSVASDEYTSDDYNAAVRDINNGKLLSLLEQVMSALSSNVDDKDRAKKSSTIGNVSEIPSKKNVKKQEGAHLSADDVFNDIKRRKVTREQLEGILKSLDSQFASQINDTETMRSIVRAYKDRSSQRQWEIFVAIVNGDYEMDPYLANISRSYDD